MDIPRIIDELRAELEAVDSAIVALMRLSGGQARRRRRFEIIAGGGKLLEWPKSVRPRKRGRGSRHASRIY